MTYSYTQISQYLACPRRYRHRYLDGWKEKDTRAAMLFGRAFERALAAYFLREDRPRSCFASGPPARITICNIRTAIPGTGCCSKAFSCWTGSARTTVSAFASPAAICRSSSPGRFGEERIRRLHRCHRELGRQALSDGVEDHHPPDILRNPRVCFLSTRN